MDLVEYQAPGPLAGIALIKVHSLRLLHRIFLDITGQLGLHFIVASHAYAHSWLATSVVGRVAHTFINEAMPRVETFLHGLTPHCRLIFILPLQRVITHVAENCTCLLNSARSYSIAALNTVFQGLTLATDIAADTCSEAISEISIIHVDVVLIGAFIFSYLLFHRCGRRVLRYMLLFFLAPFYPEVAIEVGLWDVKRRMWILNFSRDLDVRQLVRLLEKHGADALFRRYGSFSQCWIIMPYLRDFSPLLPDNACGACSIVLMPYRCLTGMLSWLRKKLLQLPNERLLCWLRFKEVSFTGQTCAAAVISGIRWLLCALIDQLVPDWLSCHIVWTATLLTWIRQAMESILPCFSQVWRFRLPRFAGSAFIVGFVIQPLCHAVALSLHLLFYVIKSVARFPRHSIMLNLMAERALLTFDLAIILIAVLQRYMLSHIKGLALSSVGCETSKDVADILIALICWIPFLTFALCFQAGLVMVIICTLEWWNIISLFAKTCLI